ncbi:MAG: hypothetical protein PHH11_05665 [Methylomonas sp.]|nr:hypothetical protein [Methylomonas sp.]
MPDRVKKLWTKVTGPSAGLVQQHYVKARQAELSRRDRGLEEKLAQFFREHPTFAHLDLSGDKWLEVYYKINKGLQNSELTINFKAENWFSTENTYDSYTQMYERAKTDDFGRVMLPNDLMNQPHQRTQVDDKVTFPKAWDYAPESHAKRGLSPGIRTGAIKKHMAFGKGEYVTGADGQLGYISMNPHFNSKTKQIFAGLNYRRQPHGAAIDYGTSHLVLHPRFKVNALYFPGDTFYGETSNAGVKKQVPYPALGSLLAYAPNMMMQNAIIASCYLNQILPDADVILYLIEAHIFSDLPFANNIVSVRLDAKHVGTDIAVNARKFAAKHGAKLEYVGK